MRSSEDNDRMMSNIAGHFTQKEGDLHNLIMYSFAMEEGKFKSGFYGKKTDYDLECLQYMYNHATSLLFEKVERRMRKENEFNIPL